MLVPRRKILVVDDEEVFADELTDDLKRKEYEASAVYDGKPGLELLLSSYYDLVVLDYAMPEMNGLQLLKAYTN